MRPEPVRPILVALLGWLSMLCAPAQAQDAHQKQQLQVADPYIELHSGPGRGYPVFFVAPRLAWVSVLWRHTDWFKVSTAQGKVGWVHREQLASTLIEAGSDRTFRDLLLDDDLHRKFEAGAAWGKFQSDPMLKFWARRRLSDALTIEATFAQVQGEFSSSNLGHVDLNVQPWSAQRWSPYFGVGLGRFKNVPNPSLVGAIETRANLTHAVLGLRYALSERFMVRTDYTFYTAFLSDARTSEYRAVTLGFSFFF